MIPVLTHARLARTSGVLLGALLCLTGCAHGPSAGRVTDGSLTKSRALEADLAALAPSVRADEAHALAERAQQSARELALEYRVVRPPLWHNTLVNLGFKKRGLCYHWAEDLTARIGTLTLTSLQLRWGMARVGTWREHNCVVVTARNQPFKQGIVLDAWRTSGRLYWVRVAEDRYPWVEGVLTPPPIAGRTAAAKP